MNIFTKTNDINCLLHPNLFVHVIIKEQKSY